ncbi:conserved membrane hypothetical protein [Nostocoides japonicum T1-X7]|uniref:DUF3159 domain-containing protein n=1 Tax=Nostocoides japonicum T1-X7 TaxID=1194083 RepID=A0A077LZF0_9MICO|nr:DUF3159 domain-containing protein [Tetrasphaera japonica]CCH79006.1 conserved membrane hypothetical protein [Tetrasphaera japonica T1-X7]
MAVPDAQPPHPEGADGAGPPEGTARAEPTTVEEHIRRSLAMALGGWRGSAETALPTVGFVVMWTWRHELKPALVVAGAIAVVTAVVRIVERKSLQFVLSGLFGIAIAAFFALRSGRAQDAFLPGILWSAGVGVASLVSIVVRWPVVGFMIGAADPQAAEDPFAWRRHPQVLKVCIRLTWVLVVLAVVRAAVMVPLYLAEQVTWLGVAKIVFGWPAWAAAVAVMGAMLLRGRTPYDPLTAPGRGGSAAPG